MEWSKEKTLMLIREFHQRPGLWNMTHENYRIKQAKRSLLAEIAVKFNNQVTEADIEKKFHTLRTQYHRELNRMNLRQGTNGYKSKWFAFAHLQFLNEPSAGRSNRENRRKFGRKVVEDTSVQLQAPLPIAGSDDVQMATTSNDPAAANSSIRKDLQVLFEETVDSEDEQDGDADTVTTTVAVYKHSGDDADLHDKETSQNCSYEEENLMEGESIHHLAVKGTTVDIVEVQKFEIESSSEMQMNTQHCASNLKRNVDCYSEMAYEAAPAPVPTTTPAPRQLHPLNVVKRVSKDAATCTRQRDVARDHEEFSVFGKYVADELRFITDRQILITCKHKINTALFEASLAQVQQNRES